MTRCAGLLFVFTLLTASGCAVVTPSIEGRVIDSTTNKPLAGAFVIEQWNYHGSDLVGSRTGCPYLAVVQTDAAGRYRLPQPDLLAIPGVGRIVFAYVPGYQDDPAASYDETRVAMKPFSGTTAQRTTSFRTFGSLRTCGSREDRIRKLQPLYRAIDQELKELGSTTIPAGTYGTLLQHMEEDFARDRMEERTRVRN